MKIEAWSRGMISKGLVAVSGGIKEASFRRNRLLGLFSNWSRYYFTVIKDFIAFTASLLASRSKNPNFLGCSSILQSLYASTMNSKN